MDLDRIQWWIRKYLPRYGGLLVIAAIVSFLLIPQFSNGKLTDMDLATFQSRSTAKEVKEATFDSSEHEIRAVLKDGTKVKVVYPAEYDDELTARLLSDGVDVKASNQSFVQKNWDQLLFFALIFLASMAPYLYSRLSVGRLVRGRRVSNVPSERYKDVLGAAGLISQFAQLKDYLQNPEKYRRAGVIAPRGFLLYGPAGNGKTLLARAIAGEAGVPFFAYSGSDFADKYVGSGAERVRGVMKAARTAGYKQPVIVFIDEVDKCGAKRGDYDDSGSHVEILNQLLVELDGFLGRDSFVVVIGATNRKEVLDPALVRPGRLTKHLYLGNPDLKAREALLALYAGLLTFLDRTVDFGRIARRLAGMSAAQVKEVCNNAGLRAVDDGDEHPVEARHFEAAMAEVALGLEQPGGMPLLEDREVVAAHEGGHALAALYTELAPQPDEVTIVPRGPYGGATMFVPSDRVLTSVQEVRAHLTAIMGGRAAERLKNGENFSEGAAHDLESATGLALRAICQWGMGESIYRAVSLESWQDDPLSEEIAREVEEWIHQAEEAATTVLRGHAPELDAVCAALHERETISGSDLRALAGV